MQDYNSLYTVDFFKQLQRPRLWQVEVGKLLYQNYPINSVVDFGCGLGFFLEGLYVSGCQKVCGIEYMYDNAKGYFSKVVGEYIKFGDLTKEIKFEDKFDLCMSVEVAEHLPESSANTFVSTMTENSSKYVLLTAAPPGQDGVSHINLQPKDYWIEKITSRGLNYNIESNKKLMNILNKINIRSKYFNVVKRNMMFFEK